MIVLIRVCLCIGINPKDTFESKEKEGLLGM
jgi:hypothetical protein